MIKSIHRYGDKALLINFEQKIDPIINQLVIDFDQFIKTAQIDGLTYTIPAYCSLTVGYDPQKIKAFELEKKLTILFAQLVSNAQKQVIKKTNRNLRIPVCYEMPYALDIATLSQEKGMSIDEIIALHSAQTYKVYMLGFLPGFVFMGKLPNVLQCKRKTSPRLRVPASSVGIAGSQTGIYPMVSPGGWQIIGQTPLKIFNPKAENPFHFQPGDEVTFYPISAKEFESFTR